MAHETVLHRFDAFEALGLPFEVSETVAGNGLREWMTTIVRITFDLRPEAASLLGSGGFYFEATDTPQKWTVDLSGTSPRVSQEESARDVAVRGSAFDIVLALYQRRGVEGLEVTGDAGLLEKFLGAMRF